MPNVKLDQLKQKLKEEIENGLRLMQHAQNVFFNCSERQLFITPEDIEIDKGANIIMIFECLFDYAMYGKAGGPFLEVEDVMDATVFVKMARPPMEFFNAEGPVICEKVIETAVARYKLDLYQGIEGADFQDYLDDPLDPASNAITLKEISCLAQMNEKSVRNATHQSKADRLVTFKIGSGTYVKPGDALAWLSKRRGYVPTVTRSPEEVSRDDSTSE